MRRPDLVGTWSPPEEDEKRSILAEPVIEGERPRYEITSDNGCLARRVQWASWSGSSHLPHSVWSVFNSLRVRS
jgi:hypothetical protein